MKLQPSDLWRWDGSIDRGPFLLLGVVLFMVKFNVDRLVSWLWFKRSWTLLDYKLVGDSLWRTLPSNVDGYFFLVLLAVSLPFLWAGLALTLRRLRSAGFPLWLVVLFFAPVIKLVFFAILCLWPSVRERTEDVTGTIGVKGFLGLVIPRSSAGSAAVGIGAACLLSLLFVWFGTAVLRNYGWSLFIGLPFCMGFVSVLVYGYHGPRSMRSCLGVALLTVGLAGVGLLVMAFEGILCLVMAAPLAAGITLMGGAVAHAIQASRRWQGGSSRLFCIAVLAVPVTMELEHVRAPEPPLLQVTTAVEVNAPPEAVWPKVVAFSELPPPREWLFRSGVAYPVRAEIRGRGVGAVRHCEFSTGPFVEPIQIWDEPRLLRFTVTSNPAPMQEWTPYHEVHPPHLNGFLESKGGQFELVRLAGGRTRLEGTTWYHHNMWPAGYWQRWSDFIIHRIHLRVLEHVKQLAEKDEPVLFK